MGNTVQSFPKSEFVQAHAADQAHAHAEGARTMKRHTLTLAMPNLEGNNSLFLRNAIRRSTVEGMGAALVRRAYAPAEPRVKKTLSLDAHTAALLNQVSTTLGLSLEETARLAIEAYRHDVAGDLRSAEQ